MQEQVHLQAIYMTIDMSNGSSKQSSVQRSCLLKSETTLQAANAFPDKAHCRHTYVQEDGPIDFAL